MTVPDTTLAWLAALIDGEGSVMVTKHKTAAARNGLRSEDTRSAYTWRVSVSVCNTDYRLMRALVAKTGVDAVYTHTRQPKENQKKTSYTWRMNTTALRVWLPIIRPWLVLKGEQVDAVLTILDLRKNGKNYGPAERLLIDNMAEAVSRMNRKGRQNG